MRRFLGKYEPGPTDPMTRVVARLTVGLDGCWLWPGGTNGRGYGLIGRGGRADKKAYVHRVIFEALRGPIEPGMEIDHLCFTRACVRPSHLEVVSRTENIARQRSHGPQKMVVA